MSSYTVSSEPGVTYCITVRAVNAVGPGAINGPSIVNGEINNHCHELIIDYPLPLQHYILSTNLVQIDPFMLTSFSTNQDTSTATASCKHIHLLL